MVQANDVLHRSISEVSLSRFISEAANEQFLPLQIRPDSHESAGLSDARGLGIQKFDGCLELRSATSRRMVLESVQRSNTTIRLAVRGQRAEASVIDWEDDDAVLAVEVASLDGECIGEFELHDVAFAMVGHLSQVRRGVSSLLLCTSPRVFFRNRRRSTRVALKRGEGNLRWAHVVHGAPRVVSSPVIDLVPTGVRIAVENFAPLIQSTAFVAELQLGKTQVPLMATVLPEAVAEGHADFARIKLATGEAHGELVKAYLQRRFARLSPRSDVAQGELAALLEVSGYLKLRAGEGVSEAWAQFAADYSLDVVYRSSEGTLLGHVSVTRSYSTTYVLHQLATLGGHRESGLCRKMLYELVSSAPHAFHGSSAFGLAYFDLDSRWHKLLLGQYVEWLADPRLGMMFAWDRFERDAARPLEAAATSLDCEVAVLRTDELVAATTLVRSQLPVLIAEGLDISPQRLSSESLNGTSARTRTALALRVDGELVGLALCETGPAGGSLFNLFNMAQFYFCTGGARPSTEQQLVLLASVRQFYSCRGINDPIVVAPAGTFDAHHESGTRLAERMGSIVLAGEGIRHWESYCSFMMGQLYQRKRVSRPPYQTYGAE